MMRLGILLPAAILRLLDGYHNPKALKRRHGLPGAEVGDRANLRSPNGKHPQPSCQRQRPSTGKLGGVQTPIWA